MTEPVAFKATYADWKLIKTRGVVQVVMEVPLADADAAYDVLGGMPVHGKERWFGIAALKSTAEEARAKPDQDSPPKHSHPDRAKRMDWREVQPAAQAGIRCADPIFIAFLKDQYAAYWINYEDAAATVRDICEVHSRSEFSTDHRKRVLWHSLDSKFQEWQVRERVGA